MSRHPLFARAAPLVFVLIWSSGFIAARAAAPHADPLVFLTLRFALVAALFGALAWLLRAPFPRTPGAIAHQLAAGILLQGAYLGATWWSVAQGLPAGVMSLIGALAPLMVALASAPLLGENVSKRQAAGIALGFAGVVLVLAPKVGAVGDTGTFTAPVLTVAVLGIVALAAGTLWQRRFTAGTDLAAASVIQNIGSGLFCGVAALIAGESHFDTGSGTLWFWLGFSVMILSIGGTSLLILLLRTRAAASATALMFLVPGVASVIAFFMFGETLTPVQIAGMGIAAAGVALATR